MATPFSISAEMAFQENYQQNEKIRDFTVCFLFLLQWLSNEFSIHCLSKGRFFSSPWNLIWANVKKGPVVSKIEFGRNQFPFQKIIEPLTVYGQLDPLHFFIIIIHVFFVLNIQERKLHIMSIYGSVCMKKATLCVVFLALNVCHPTTFSSETSFIQEQEAKKSSYAICDGSTLFFVGPFSPSSGGIFL